MKSAAMEAITFQQQATPKIKLKSIALPAEHGGWGFLLEPIVIGLLIAPSPAGFFLSLATIAAFLTRHPLRLTVLNFRAKKNSSARTSLARKFTLVYGAAALAFFVTAILTSTNSFWIPLLIAAPFAFVQLRADFTNRSRSLLAELSGAIALGAVASCIVLAAGWSLPIALSVWVIMITRIVPSILFVRAMLRINRGIDISGAKVILSHIIGLLIVIAIFLKGFGPALACAASLILLIRAGHGISAYSIQTTAKVIGIREVVYGSLMTIALAVGYAFNF
jgi:hypothetical protein